MSGLEFFTKWICNASEQFFSESLFLGDTTWNLGVFCWLIYIYTLDTPREKNPNTEFFLVRIFLYSERTRRFTKEGIKTDSLPSLLDWSQLNNEYTYNSHKTASCLSFILTSQSNLLKSLNHPNLDYKIVFEKFNVEIYHQPP